MWAPKVFIAGGALTVETNDTGLGSGADAKSAKSMIVSRQYRHILSTVRALL